MIVGSWRNDDAWVDDEGRHDALACQVHPRAEFPRRLELPGSVDVPIAGLLKSRVVPVGPIVGVRPDLLKLRPCLWSEAREHHAFDLLESSGAAEKTDFGIEVLTGL